MLAFQRNFGARSWLVVHLKSGIRYNYAISFVWLSIYFLTRGPVIVFYVAKIIYQSSDVIFSKPMTDPPFPLPLELPYLQYPLSMKSTFKGPFRREMCEMAS
jgi:hypothetical protein